MGKARSPGGGGSGVNSMGILTRGGKGHVGLTEFLNDFVGTTQGANADSRLLREFTSNNWTNLMADPANVQKVNGIIDNNLPNQWNGGPTYRGINISDADLAKLRPGAVIPQKPDGVTAVSWSSVQARAESFASGSQNRVVLVNESQRTRGISIKPISNYATESEVLVHGRQRMRVNRTEQKGGITYVHISNIP